MIPYFAFQEINFGLATVQVWGFAASIGFLLALFVSVREGKKRGIGEDQIWDVMILALLGMIVGSKLLYLLSSQSWEEIFSASGFSFLGGVATAAILCYIYAVRRKINIWELADSLTLGVIVALIAIRIGCFLVYDHIGKITSWPWGMEYVDGTVRHPVSLYLVVKAVAAFGIISYFGKKNLRAGTLFLIFALYYSISRFLIDFTRCDDFVYCDQRYLGLTYTQWILLASLPFVCFAIYKKAQHETRNMKLKT